MASVCVEYVSVGCNRTPQCVDWNINGLLAYGADRSIALARESTYGCGPDKVVAMLHGHSDRANCVRWVSPRSGHAQYMWEHRAAVELVSGSVDKNVIVWKKSDGDMFIQSQVLSSHSSSVTCVAAVNFLSDGDTPSICTLIASGAADSTVNIWERSNPSGEFNLLQTIPFGRGFVFGLDFFELPGIKGQPILACGGDDARVNIFARKGGKFVRVLSLTGHEDWVRDVSLAQEDGGDVLLVSCSQDGYIRLWRISKEDTVEATPTSHPADHTPFSDDLKLTSNVFSVEKADGEGSKFTVTVESVLIGHEDWVYSVQWQPLQIEPTISQPLCVLSASMDKTMLLWKPDPDSGVWMEQVRVGEVGGNSLGLYGGRFCSQGDMIIGQGYQGAFHLWKKSTLSKTKQPKSSADIKPTLDSQSDSVVSDSAVIDKNVPPTSSPVIDQSEHWTPLPTLSGHFGAVQDISWEPKSGEFLISVSTDQTSRLHAPWRQNLTSAEEAEQDELKNTDCVMKETKNEKKGVQWREIARPQIHGYDMQCIAMINSLLYISGADEKVLRVFGAPKNFVGNLQRISGVGLSDATKDLPMGASVPSLGLSNKAVFDYSRDPTAGSEAAAAKNAFGDAIPVFVSIDLQEPPVEAHLLQNTLWPETQKLYGHGYEIFCVDSSPDGKYIASACKASKPEHASIRVWSTSTWRQVTTLPLHTLTVTQLAFSHSGEFLLAVSRDRCWSLWKLSEDSTEEAALDVSLVAHSDKTVRSHTRIIWSCSWSCDDSCFATASRDKRVFLWSQCSCVDEAKDCGERWRVAIPPLECDQSVTAVDFAPHVTKDSRHILAVGLENGHISIYTCPSISPIPSPCNFWSQLLTIPPSLCHTSTVKRLEWQPSRHRTRATNIPLTSSEIEKDTNKTNSTIDSSDKDDLVDSKGLNADDLIDSKGLSADVTVGGCNSLCLASCSTDHCVKVFTITLT